MTSHPQSRPVSQMHERILAEAGTATRDRWVPPKPKKVYTKKWYTQSEHCGLTKKSSHCNSRALLLGKVPTKNSTKDQKGGELTLRAREKQSYQPTELEDEGFDTTDCEEICNICLIRTRSPIDVPQKTSTGVCLISTVKKHLESRLNRKICIVSIVQHMLILFS